MTARDQLRVRVNDELVVDAGTCEEVSGPHGPERLIRSPKATLSQQVLAYLRAKPDPPRRPSGSMVGREGVAAAALALRWGSYLAVLLDRDKPVWPEVRSARKEKTGPPRFFSTSRAKIPFRSQSSRASRAMATKSSGPGVVNMRGSRVRGIAPGARSARRLHVAAEKRNGRQEP